MVIHSLLLLKDTRNSFSIEQLYIFLQQYFHIYIYIYSLSRSIGFERCAEAMKFNQRIDMALRAEFYCWMLHSKMSKLRSILQYILNSYISFYNNTFIYIYIYSLSLSIGFERCVEAMKFNQRIDVALRAEFYC